MDDPDNPDSEEFWAMEATCNAHVYHFKLRDEEMQRHIREDHAPPSGVDSTVSPM